MFFKEMEEDFGVNFLVCVEGMNNDGTFGFGEKNWEEWQNGKLIRFVLSVYSVFIFYSSATN